MSAAWCYWPRVECSGVRGSVVFVPQLRAACIRLQSAWTCTGWRCRHCPASVHVRACHAWPMPSRRGMQPADGCRPFHDISCGAAFCPRKGSGGFGRSNASSEPCILTFLTTGVRLHAAATAWWANDSAACTMTGFNITHRTRR